MNGERDSERKQIGTRIAHERESAGYTQAQLAEAIEIDPTVLSRIEGGSRGIDSLVLRRIARKLDLPMDRFFVPTDEGVVMARGEGGGELLEWARDLLADIKFVEREASRFDGTE